MGDIKYIVTDRKAVAIFNPSQGHDEVARQLYGKPVGAGFLHFDVDGERIKVRCYGSSVSLRIDSRGEVDEAIINKFINQDHY